MKRKTGLGAWIVYLAVRMVFAIMQMFPIHWNLGTARLLVHVWVRLMPRHRNRAIAHLKAAFGDRFDDDEINRLAHRSLESVAMFAVEAICLPRLITRFTWSRYIKPVNYEDLIDLIIQGRGVILVTGHYGSFEVMGHLICNLGFNLTAVMRPLDNVYINRFLVDTRRMHGLELLDKKGAMTEAEDRLRGGALLAFIGDQDAGRKGLFVEFFGQPASTYKSIGLLAMATDRPIAVGYARRCGQIAQYDVGVQRIIRPEEWARQDDPLRWITQTYTSAIEDTVRENPEQYLWIHRRWKSKPKRARTMSGTDAPSGTKAVERSENEAPTPFSHPVDGRTGSS